MNKKKSARNGEENIYQIQESEHENLQNTQISSFKIIASQITAVLPIFFFKARFGMETGFTAVMIPELSKNNTEIDVTLDELTWFSSYCFMFPVAVLAGGFVTQSIGCRFVLAFSHLLHLSANLLFHWANSVPMILVAQVCEGLSSGMSRGIAFSHVAEVVQPKFRSIILTALSISFYFGRFFTLLLGKLMYWRTETLVLLVFPSIGLILVYFLPESPQWLVSKNRFEDAEKSLRRLRGWAAPGAVKAELHTLMNVPNSLLAPVETPSDNDLNTRKLTMLKKTISMYLDRSFYIPLLTVASMYFFADFNSADPLISFSGLLFDKNKLPIDGSIASVLFSSISVFGLIFSISTVRFLGRRILSLASVLIIAVCLVVAGTLLYLTSNNLIESEIYSWIILIALITILFAHTGGIGVTVCHVSSEIFPQKSRYISNSIVAFINEIMLATVGKIFLYIVKEITLSGTLIVFAIINFIGFIFIYFMLPETEGASLQEIEDHYTGKHRLKNKH